MEIIKTNNAKVEAIDYLTNLIQGNLNNPILILLSGGSWLSLYENIIFENNNSNITIGVLDERFSSNDYENNFAQFTKTNFYKFAMKNNFNFIDTRIDNDESLSELAKRFKDALFNWKNNNPEGKIIATIGMGIDGHTAGVFSGCETVKDYDSDWVLGYEIDESINQFTKRVTVTPNFIINEIDFAVAYVSGMEKCTVLQRIKAEDVSQLNLPVQIWKQMKNLKVFTDC